jgi:hypothetical protein
MQGTDATQQVASLAATPLTTTTAKAKRRTKVRAQRYAFDPWRWLRRLIRDFERMF